MAEIDHAGKLLYAASSRGPTVYTAFIATRAAIARQREVFAAATRALAKMEQWLYANSAQELSKAVAPFFPHVPKDILVPSLQRYRDAGLWAHNPAMSKQGFNRLGLSFVSAGLLLRPRPMKIVSNRISYKTDRLSQLACHNRLEQAEKHHQTTPIAAV